MSRNSLPCSKPTTALRLNAGSLSPTVNMISSLLLSISSSYRPSLIKVRTSSRSRQRLNAAPEKARSPPGRAALAPPLLLLLLLAAHHHLVGVHVVAFEGVD